HPTRTSKTTTTPAGCWLLGCVAVVVVDDLDKYYSARTAQPKTTAFLTTSLILILILTLNLLLLDPRLLTAFSSRSNHLFKKALRPFRRISLRPNRPGRRLPGFHHVHPIEKLSFGTCCRPAYCTVSFD
ncbi:hypothetical protein CLAIMM_07840, partial [Cladophialophora immunda]